MKGVFEVSINNKTMDLSERIYHYKYKKFTSKY